jgi:hypothetical protein
LRCSDTSLQSAVRATFPRGLEERVSMRVLFSVLRVEVGTLEKRLYTMLERVRTGAASMLSLTLTCQTPAGHSHARPLRCQAGGGDVNLEDVLRALALVAAGKLPQRGREPRHGLAAPLPPPLPPSAWEERAAGDGGLSELRAAFAFQLCAPRARLRAASRLADNAHAPHTHTLTRHVTLWSLLRRTATT